MINDIDTTTDLSSDVVYLVTIMDNLAKAASTIVQVPSLNYLPRIYKSSMRPGMDPKEYDLYILGTFNVVTMSIETYPEPAKWTTPDIQRKLAEDMSDG